MFFFTVFQVFPKGGVGHLRDRSIFILTANVRQVNGVKCVFRFLLLKKKYGIRAGHHGFRCTGKNPICCEISVNFPWKGHYPVISFSDKLSLSTPNSKPRE